MVVTFPGHMLTHFLKDLILMYINRSFPISIKMMAHYFNCVVVACVLCLFLAVPWVGLHTVVVEFLAISLLTLRRT